MVLVFVGMSMFFVVMFSSLAHNPSVRHNQGPPPGFVFLVPLLWLGFMGGWLLNLIVGVVYAIKANRGEWATYPIFGKWLLRQTLPSAK